MIATFEHPGRLWLLLAVPILACWLAIGARRRAREWSALGQPRRPIGDGARAWLSASALLVLALAQPRWGLGDGSRLPDGQDVVLLVDASRSMAAEDAFPSRLARAIEAGSSLIRALEPEPGARVAVVEFAGRAVVRCPLTSSLGSALEILGSLRAGEVDPGGTDLGAALDVAVGAFDPEEHAQGRTVVILSDGEDHAGSWPEAVGRLVDAGIVVHGVAIGDPDRAHPVPGPADPPGRASRPETRRSDAAFEAIAKATGGALVPLGVARGDLGALFRDRIAPVAKFRREELRTPERVERFPAFLLAAIGIGLAGSWPGWGRRRGRRLAFAILAVAVIPPLLGAGPDGPTAAGLVAKGRSSYGEGRHADALADFERAIEADPRAAIPRYDAGAALFQLRRFPEAIARYEEAGALGDEALKIKVDYALGNSFLAIGDPAGAVARYDACLASTLSDSASESVRADARLNRAFALERLTTPPDPTAPDPDRPGSSNAPRPRPRPSREGRRGGDPSESPASSPGSGGDGPTETSDPSPGTRGAGGAGGGGQAPPESGSPGARLDAMLEDLREARSRRPPDPSPRPSKGSDKDW